MSKTNFTIALFVICVNKHSDSSGVLGNGDRLYTSTARDGASQKVIADLPSPLGEGLFFPRARDSDYHIIYAKYAKH